MNKELKDCIEEVKGWFIYILLIITVIAV